LVPLPMRCRRRSGMAAQALGMAQYRDLDAFGGREACRCPAPTYGV
jgi:hypothetical protein